MRAQRFRMLFLLIGICMLTGCSSSEMKLTAGEYDTNTLTIDEKDTIRIGMVEDFDKEYYSEQELKDYLEEEVEFYNGANGEGSVSMTSFEVSGEKASAVLEYKNIDCYTEHMGVEADLMTIEEAFELGLLTDVSIKAGDGTEADLEAVKEQGGYKVLVLNEEFDVIVPEAIEYCANCSIYNTTSVHTEPGESSFIIFK